MTHRTPPQLEGIELKKVHGQHFLRDTHYIDHMLAAVHITPDTSLLEIGCGNGVLTKALLATPASRVWVYEIDPEWAEYVSSRYPNKKLSMHVGDVMRADLRVLASHAPWIMLANLPYKITFPVLHLMKQYHHVWQEGVIMIQEDVAQKILQTSGRGFGWQSLYFQHYFSWKLLDKVPPEAFYPPPRVTSRLVHWKPRHDRPEIPDEQKFWSFVKVCFAHPRRTIKNNLALSTYASAAGVTTKFDQLRAQQMSCADFLALWNQIRSQ